MYHVEVVIMHECDTYVLQTHTYTKSLRSTKQIQLRYTPSADNVSDIFTKALGKITFTHLRNRLMGTPTEKPD